MNAIFNFFGSILAFFYGLIPNLGIAIILLTVLVMLVLFPLTAKQAKSMMAMQRAQPEIKKIQAKYKNDKQKQNEEVMKFYQENRINPLAGCLPLLVQLPVFISLFRVLRKPYEHIPVDSELFHAFCHPVRNADACDKGDLPHALKFLGMDLSTSAVQVSGGFIKALPYFLLVGLVIATGFLQARQSRRNAPNMTGQMAVIQTIMPIGFGLFSLQFPAGLVLYYLVSNTWRLGQQEIIIRHVTGPAPGSVRHARSGGAIDVKSAVVKEGSAGGGLRRRFQLPTPAAPTGNGAPEAESAAERASTPTSGNKAELSGNETASAPGNSGAKTSGNSGAKTPANGGTAKRPPAGAGGPASGTQTRSGSGAGSTRRKKRKRR